VKKIYYLGSVAALMLNFSSTPTAAESIKSVVTATNGVEVTVYADEFAGRSEFTAPSISFPNLGGFALVARVSKNAVTRPLEIVGSIMYNGEWRYYNSAILRGGEIVDSTFNERKVGSCSGSRYSGGCSLNEGFTIRPTPAQVTKYSENGNLQIQMQAQSGASVLVTIPISYIAAVNEIAKAK
jgi:hypothetical protein